MVFFDCGNRIQVDHLPGEFIEAFMRHGKLLDFGQSAYRCCRDQRLLLTQRKIRLFLNIQRLQPYAAYYV